MFKETVEAKYSLKDRITQKVKPKDLKAPLTLVAWSVQKKLYRDLQSKIEQFLDSKGIKWQLPIAKDPHISVALTSQLNHMERDAILRIGKTLTPIYKIVGIELLKGLNTPVDYIALKLNAPEGHVKMFTWLQDRLGKNRVGDYRSFFKDHVPHITLLSVEKGDGKVQKVLKEMREHIPTRAFMFKPEFVLLFDKFQISQWEEVG